MEIQSQNFLRGLDTDNNGLSVRELRQLDTDNDGQLSVQEVGEGNISADDLAEVNQRLRNFDSMTEVVRFPTMVPGRGPETRSLPDTTVIIGRAEVNSTLFPGGVEGISPSDIDQGSLSDCFFLSSLAGMAEHRPQEIMDMINENPDGTFTVRFPGADRSVTVEPPTPEELRTYARPGQNGSTWVAVLEKAYAELNHGNLPGFIRDQVSARDTIDYGGMLSDGIGMVTGHSTDTDILALTRDSTTRDKLEDALSNGRVVTASTFLGGSDDHHIADSHVYTILAYDRDSDTVTIRNPWGSGHDATGIENPDSRNDGTFTLTLAEFNEFFTAVGYEQAE